MLQVDDCTLIIAFLGVGLSTFFFRAIFLYYQPTGIQTSQIIRKGLESVPATLLVALVVPYALFIDGTFNPLRIEVVAILLAIPILIYIKKPGLSLPVAILLYFLLTIF